MQFYQFFNKFVLATHQNINFLWNIVFIWSKLVNFAFVQVFESLLYNLIGFPVFLN